MYVSFSGYFSSSNLCHGHPTALAVEHVAIFSVVQVPLPLPQTVTSSAGSSKLSGDFAQSKLVMVGIRSPCFCEETERKATNWPERISGTAQKYFFFPNSGLIDCKLFSRFVQIVCHAGLARIALHELKPHIVVGAIIRAAASLRGDLIWWTCITEHINAFSFSETHLKVSARLNGK